MTTHDENYESDHDVGEVPLENAPPRVYYFNNGRILNLTPQLERQNAEEKKDNMPPPISHLFNTLRFGPLPNVSYAEVAARNNNLRDFTDMPFPNDVIPRNRAQDSMYNILDEIENLREQVPENAYLNISNQLRTVYDYISQHDSAPIWSRPDDAPTWPRPNSIPREENLGALNLRPTMATFYYLLKWFIHNAPFNILWQILIFVIWFNIAIVFTIIGAIFSMFNKFNSAIMSKIINFGLIFAEEILLCPTEIDVPFRNLLLDTIRLSRRTISAR